LFPACASLRVLLIDAVTAVTRLEPRRQLRAAAGAGASACIPQQRGAQRSLTRRLSAPLRTTPDGGERIRVPSLRIDGVCAVPGCCACASAAALRARLVGTQQGLREAFAWRPLVQPAAHATGCAWRAPCTRCSRRCCSWRARRRLPSTRRHSGLASTRLRCAARTCRTSRASRATTAAGARGGRAARCAASTADPAGVAAGASTRAAPVTSAWSLRRAAARTRAASCTTGVAAAWSVPTRRWRKATTTAATSRPATQRWRSACRDVPGTTIVTVRGLGHRGPPARADLRASTVPPSAGPDGRWGPKLIELVFQLDKRRCCGSKCEDAPPPTASIAAADFSAADFAIA